MISTALRVLLLSLLLCGNAAAARESSPAEKKVTDTVAVFMTTQGLPFLQPNQEIMDRTEEAAISQENGLAGIVAAAGINDTIMLTEESARSARIFSHVMEKKSRRSRRNAFYACGDPCLEIVQTSLHEMVHLYRMRLHRNFEFWDVQFEEGLAESVAVDLTCPFLRKSVGFRILDCVNLVDMNYVAYEDYTAYVRALSSDVTGYKWNSVISRTWRLRHLLLLGVS